MKRDCWDKEFRTMVTFGMSITAGGWSSCRERRWTNLLAGMIGDYQRMPVQLVNVGVGANLISPRSPGYEYSQKPSASERLEEHVLSNTANGAPVVPDLLIMAFGLNDARSGTPVAQFCEDLKEVIRRVREKFNPLIVLLGSYYVKDFELGAPHWNHSTMETLREYDAAVSLLAQQCDCLFVDLLSAFGEADWLVHYDGVHSNDLGHRVVANKVFEVLAKNCSGLAMETKELEKHIQPWRDESTLHEGY